MNLLTKLSSAVDWLQNKIMPNIDSGKTRF